MWLLALLLSCNDAAPGPSSPTAPPGPGPATAAPSSQRAGPASPQAAAQAARAAPLDAAPWSGPWTVELFAAQPQAAGVVALAQGLGVDAQLWTGSRPQPARGQVAALWLDDQQDPSLLQQRLRPAPGTPPGGVVVAVLGPGQPQWRAQAAAALPWAGVGVVDGPAEAARYLELSHVTPALAGGMAGRVLAQHYDLSWHDLPLTAGAARLPPGLAQLLGPARPDDRRSPDPRVRAEAVRRIGAGDDGTTLLADPSPAVRLALAATTTDVALLTTLAHDAEPLVRARALDRLPPAGASQRTDASPIRPLTTALDDPSSVVRVIAAHSLARQALYGPPTGRAPALAALARAATSSDAYVRWKAAWGLGADATQRRLLETLLGDADADVRRQAARSLGRLGDKAALPALTAALDDQNSFVRRWAAEALGALGDPAAIPVLTAHANEPTALVAAAAARALDQLGQPTSAPPYRPPGPPGSHAEADALSTKPDATSRKDVAKFLGGKPEYLTVLRRLAADEDSEVRKSAIEALGWTPGTRADLLAAVDDPDPDCRVTALDGLRRQGSGDAEAIIRALQDPDAEISLRAAEALGQATSGASAATSPAAQSALRSLLRDPDERMRTAAITALPTDLDPDEPSLVVRMAGQPPADPDQAAWLAGIIAREDDLLHLRFSWNEDDDQPRSYRALRPPVIRPYGHPDRG